MTIYTLQQWSEYLGITYEEVYEDDISHIILDDDNGKIYKQMTETGELILID